MTKIALNNGQTETLTESEKVTVNALTSVRHSGEPIYFCDDPRFCESSAPDRFIGTREQAAETLNDWAYGTWQRDERGNYGTVEEIKAGLLEEMLAASHTISIVDDETRYKVISKGADFYTIFPAAEKTPPDFSEHGVTGDYEECRAYISEIKKDPNPISSEHMEEFGY